MIIVKDYPRKEKSSLHLKKVVIYDLSFWPWPEEDEEKKKEKEEKQAEAEAEKEKEG